MQGLKSLSSYPGRSGRDDWSRAHRQLIIAIYRATRAKVAPEVADFWGEISEKCDIVLTPEDRKFCGTICAQRGCESTEVSPMICGRCRGVRYCSSECQKG